MNKVLLPLVIGSVVFCTTGSGAADSGLLATFSRTSPQVCERVELRANHQYDQTVYIKATIPPGYSAAVGSYVLPCHGTWRLLNVPASAVLSASLPPGALVEIKSALTPGPTGETSVQYVHADRRLAISALTFPKTRSK